MTKIVSFINLKGGVGKTTVTVNIASILAEKYGHKVLVVDLDPQTNATVSLINQEHWQERSIAKQTLYDMFYDLLHNEKNFNIDNAILKSVSDIDNLDLLPSSLDLVQIQDNIPEISNKEYINFVDVLANQLERVKAQYDYILIDCPPNLGSITLNGINISNFYIIPTVPDILSKIGINLILNRIDQFVEKKHSCNIKLAGLIFTKVDVRTNLHSSTKRELRNSEELEDFVFENEMPTRISIAEAPVDSRPHVNSSTARSKNDYKATHNLIVDITDEFIKKIEAMEE
jgi:chromosome partitioning protein